MRPAVHRSMVLSLIAAISIAVPTAAGLAQQTPVFRAAVDVIAVDVVALDKSGMPVANLTAADFAIVAGGRPRRVLGADFVRAGDPVRRAGVARAPTASSNAHVVVPRSILLVVDVNQIPAGGGRLALKTIGASLDQLAPVDRVGVMTLADTRIALTTDRVAARRALDELVGASVRLRDREMTFGEATGIAARDRRTLQAYWNRIVDQGYSRPGNRTCAPPRGFDTLRDVTPECVQVAEAVLDRARLETGRVLDRLRHIAAALGTHDGSKAIVFVSGGLVNDSHTRAKLDAFAEDAERARVAVHALLIEAEGGMAGRSSVETSQFDRQIGLAGLSELTNGARGSVQLVQGDAAPAFAQIDRRLAGYYVVSFERLADDRDNVRQTLEVRITRPQVTVLASRGVTPVRSASADDRVPPSPKSGVADLLRSSTGSGQVPMTVDAFAVPAPTQTGDARAIVVVEIERDASAVAAFGFQIAELSGRVIGDGYEEPAKVQSTGRGTSTFVTTVPIGGGRYIARFAAIDRDGRRGSVEHTFDAPAGLRESIAVSDVIFGDRTGGDFRPAVRAPGARTLPVRLVIRDVSQRFDNVVVQAIVTSGHDFDRVDQAAVPLIVTADPVRRFADLDLSLDRYPAEELVVTLVVTVGGNEVARRQRLVPRR